MASSEAVPAADADTEYRAIEKALLQSERGRWFLAEHSRRSRRTETSEIEEALQRFKSTLRQPPAVLGRVRSELGSLEAMLAETKAHLMACTQPAAAADSPTAHLLKTAEDLHELVWSLQAREIDPAACEEIGRRAMALFALTARQAQESQRALKASAALDVLLDRVSEVLRSIGYEARDEDEGPVSAPWTTMPHMSRP